MTRKTLTVIAILLLAALALTACATNSGATGAVKQGFGSVNRINKSKDAGDADGLAQVDAVIAAVTLDSTGKIVAVNIDSIQAKVAFTKEGKLVTDPATLVQTKKEQGDAYGMKKVSSLNKEWYEQIEALEKWLVGKTKTDIDNMKLTEGKSDDLKASVTITVTDYIEAVKKAIADAG
jgi:predicted small secreted protein